jgi:hypothetical protein
MNAANALLLPPLPLTPSPHLLRILVAAQVREAEREAGEGRPAAVALSANKWERVRVLMAAA